MQLNFNFSGQDWLNWLKQRPKQSSLQNSWAIFQ